MKKLNFSFLGAILGLLAVAFGAFGAHALKTILDPASQAIYQTATQYHFYHAMAIVGYAEYAARTSSKTWPAWCFTIGTVIFSGSLYALALTQIKILGAITPFGGALFLLGWLGWAKLACRKL